MTVLIRHVPNEDRACEQRKCPGLNAAWLLIERDGDKRCLEYRCSLHALHWCQERELDWGTVLKLYGGSA